ncbi:hypothetical protein HPB52_000369 [Rhipicephalus sanguineus]|uniref:Uncharacterized protein n=1 Tax=Rhipicephalus sanguineus TaxID=34632 RepID=A0A9D4PUA1_RHISA|nr:hypothetical protein HPB52_000369 [Rhipicephalus sanguineus]
MLNGDGPKRRADDPPSQDENANHYDSWTPEGRRLITGASSGEFTLWNGLTFNFETILQGDHSGYVKYWQSNMNNVKMFQGHKEAIRGISVGEALKGYLGWNQHAASAQIVEGNVRGWQFVIVSLRGGFVRFEGADEDEGAVGAIAVNGESARRKAQHETARNSVDAEGRET